MMTTWLQRIADWASLGKAQPHRTGPSNAGPSSTGPSSTGPSNVGPVNTEEDIARLFGQAKAAHAKGDVAALRWVAEAIGGSRQLAAEQPEDPRHRTALASMLYSAGSMFNAFGNPGGALDVLDESRALYEELGRGGLERADMLVADVDARRARALAMLQQGASAVVAIDAAVRFYRMRAAVESREHSVHRDLARVLSIAAKIQFEFGDTDLAVGAADQAIRIYVFQAAIINRLPDAQQHVDSMTEAALIAEHVHAQDGRAELQTAVATMLTSLIPAADRLDAIRKVVAQTHERKVRSEPTLVGTLAQSLRRLGRPELVDLLTAPATDCIMVIPSDRAGSNMGLVGQQLLACIGPELDPADVLRIGLEAHALLASASARGLLRHDLPVVGPAWLRVLVRCADLLEAGGNARFAGDLLQWARGLADQLAPLSIVDKEVSAALLDVSARLEHDQASRFPQAE